MGWRWPPAPGTVSSESGTKQTSVMYSNTACQLPPAAPVYMSHLICWAGPHCVSQTPPSPPAVLFLSASRLLICEKRFSSPFSGFSFFTQPFAQTSKNVSSGIVQSKRNERNNEISPWTGSLADEERFSVTNKQVERWCVICKRV